MRLQDDAMPESRADVLQSSRLHMELDWLYHDFPDNPASCLDFAAIFTPAMCDIATYNTHVLTSSAIQLPSLTHMLLFGLCTQPRIIYDSAPRLLTNAPNIECWKYGTGTARRCTCPVSRPWTSRRSSWR